LDRDSSFVTCVGGHAVRHEKVTLRLIARPTAICQDWTYEYDIAGASWKAVCESNGALVFIRNSKPIYKHLTL
jgi:hypothetical protein